MELKPEFEVHLICNEKESFSEVKGSAISLLTALSGFARMLKDNDLSDEQIRYAVDLGLMTNEEIAKDTKRQLKELLNDIL